MREDQKEYFSYLKNRTKLSFLIRKFTYRSIMKTFRGKILDVGCGLGELLELYKNSVGIDKNSYCVEYCRKKGHKCFVGDIYKIPFKKNSFNGILISHVFEHLSNPKRAIKEVKRVLKNNGKLLIIVPTEKDFSKDKTHVKFWNEENLVKFLRDNKFNVIRKTYYPIPNRTISNKLTYGELRIISVNKKSL